MAQKTANAVTGSTEDIRAMLVSELIIEVLQDALSAEEIKEITDLITQDHVVFSLPDTGKAKFTGSHTYTAKSGTDKGKEKDSKATFVVAELGSNFAGVNTGFSQDNGDHAGLDLIAKISIIAQPPNTAGKTVDEALNRKPATLEVVKTGTDN